MSWGEEWLTKLKELGGYDLSAAFEYNDCGLSAAPSALLYEIAGQNDYANWHWILSLESGRYAYVVGGCDYTGWDCQSQCEVYEADTFEEVMRLVPDSERHIFSAMAANGDGQ